MMAWNVDASETSPRRLFAELKERAIRLAPEWSERGPEDPGWVLLEVFAEALSDLEREVDEAERRVYPSVLEWLAPEPRWARAATGAVVFSPAEGWKDPILVPRGTVIAARRAPGAPGTAFETLRDAWCSSARLERVASRSGNEHAELFPYPQGGWNGDPVPLFGRQMRILRCLYLGDPLLQLLRDRSGALILEWPGVPAILAEGSWEASVRGGWRAIQVGLEEARSAKGKRIVRMRIAGPIPDLAEERIEGSQSAWIRLSLPGARRVVLPHPSWAAVESEGLPSAREIDSSRVFAGGQLLSFPRPVLRVLSSGGEKLEDHSLSAQKIQAVDVPDGQQPAVYLGWDEPAPGSVYWSLERRTIPLLWEGEDGRRQPRLEWEYSSGRGFQPLEVDDGTCGFTQSGCVTWKLPGEWTPQEQCGERLHWIRARWVSGAYFSPPIIRAVLPHAAAILGGRSLEGFVADAVVSLGGRASLELSFAEGDPERFHRLELARGGEGWKSLVSMGPPTQECARAAEPPEPEADVKPPTASGGGQDSSRGTGDGSREGFFTLRRSPRGFHILDVDPSWAGPVKLRIPRLRVGLGASGNLPPGTLSVLEADLRGLQRVIQPTPTEGGVDAEDSEAFQRRLRAEWTTGSRVVTQIDFRRHCRALDPEIGRVDVSTEWGTPGHVVVTVLPMESWGPGRFQPTRLEWLAEMLQAMAPLGTSVDVVEPVYIPVEVRARTTEPVLPPPEPVRREIEDRLRRYLHPLRGGRDGRGFPLGRHLDAEALSATVTAVIQGTAGASSVSDEPERVARVPAAEDSPRRARPAGDSVSPRSAGSVLGAWDSGPWRFDVTGVDGRPLSQAVVLSMPSPPILPSLERLVFELPDRPMAR